MYSKQSYYDELICRVIDGGFPSVDNNNDCMYRTKDGNKCAAGILIPDSLYMSKLEGALADDDDVVQRLQIPDGMCLMDVKIIQSIHDTESWNWNLELFVKKINTLKCFYDVKKIKLEVQK